MLRFPMASVTAKSIEYKAMGSFWRGQLQDLTLEQYPRKACSPEVYNILGSQGTWSTIGMIKSRLYFKLRIPKQIICSLRIKEIILSTSDMESLQKNILLPLADISG